MRHSPFTYLPEVRIFGSQDSRKLRIVAFLAFATLAAMLIAWTWSGELSEFGGDSAAYLLISRLYSPYHPVSQAVLAFKSQIIYPPLFPFFLAIVDGGYNLFAAHILVAIFLFLSAFALHIWMRQEGFPFLLRLIVAFVWCLIPANLLQVFNIWTEYPYIFFSLATVVALSDDQSVTPLKNWYWAAIFVACATLIRTAALPLCFAFLAYSLLKQPRYFLRLAAISIIPIVVWALYSGHTEQGSGSYVKQLAEMYSGDPLQKFLHQLAMEFAAVKLAWPSSWLGTSHSPLLALIANIFGCICLVGWLYRLIKLRFDAIYAGIYLLLLFMWAHPEEASRYAMVIYPIFVVSGFSLVYQLSKMVEGGALPRLLPVFTAGILIIVLIPTWVLYAERYLEPTTDEISTVRHSDYWYFLDDNSAKRDAYFQVHLFHHLREIAKGIAPDECIFSIKPPIVTLFTDRSSFNPPKINVDDQEFDVAIQKCHYAYVLPFDSPSFPGVFYPMQRLGQRAKLVSQFNDGAGQMYGGLLEIAH